MLTVIVLTCIVLGSLVSLDNVTRKKFERKTKASLEAEINSLKRDLDNSTRWIFEAKVRLLQHQETISKLLSIQTNSGGQPNTFTNDELKRIRFAIHPDKTNGKTTELWRKVNDLIK